MIYIEDSPPNTPISANREAKNAQRIIKDLERRNSDITAELDKAKQATTESMNLSKSHVRRIQQLENELSQVKHMNQALMEENEGFQLLLHEKTMKGEFMLNPFMQVMILYKTIVSFINLFSYFSFFFFFFFNYSKDESSSPQDDDIPDLAAELDRASLLNTFLLGERVHKESDHTIVESSMYLIIN